MPTTFEKDTYFHLWEDRFECLTCKNIICQGCYWSFTNHKVIPDEDIDNCRYYGELDENGLVDGCPGKDCPIICPFCRTRDYKIFYNNKMPYELLNEIKNRNIF